MTMSLSIVGLEARLVDGMTAQSVYDGSLPVFPLACVRRPSQRAVGGRLSIS